MLNIKNNGEPEKYFVDDENCKKVKNILILQYKPFGDVLLNTGYLPFLRQKFPNAQLDYLVMKPYDQILLNNPDIDNLISFSDGKGFLYIIDRIKLLLKIRQNNYDIVIDQLRGTGSAMFTLFSGAKFRLGFKKKRFNFLYNINPLMGEKRYYSRMKFDLIAPIGIPEKPHKLYFHIEEASNEFINNWLRTTELKRNEFIAIAPGSPVRRKKWNPKNYAMLADLLNTELGIKTVLVGSPAEIDDINSVVSSMRTKAINSPKTTLNQAAALIKASKLLICNDGGLNHLSIAVETPSLSIFGSTNPVKWSGSELKDHWVLHDPSTNSRIDNSFGITPRETLNKVKDILNQIKK